MNVHIFNDAHVVQRRNDKKNHFMSSSKCCNRVQLPQKNCMAKTNSAKACFDQSSSCLVKRFFIFVLGCEKIPWDDLVKMENNES
jgi:hypothetical protein